MKILNQRGKYKGKVEFENNGLQLVIHEIYMEDRKEIRMFLDSFFARKGWMLSDKAKFILPRTREQKPKPEFRYDWEGINL